MAIEFNPQLQSVAQTKASTTLQGVNKANGYATASTIVSLNAAPKAEKSDKPWYSFIYDNFATRLVGRFINFLKNLCCGSKGKEEDTRTDLQKLQDFAKMYDQKDVKADTVLAAFAKLPEAMRNEVYGLVYNAAKADADKLEEPKGQKFLEANILDGRVKGVVLGYTQKQEKIQPLKDFLKIVEDGSKSAKDVEDAFNDLPSTQYEVGGVKNTVAEMLKHRLWELNGNNDEGKGIGFGVHFIQTRPHDEKLKNAIKDVMAQL
jgi:hypothetical protein